MYMGISHLELAFWLAALFGPTIIAVTRGRRDYLAILAVSLLLGWTVVGLIAAYVWAAHGVYLTGGPNRRSPADATIEREDPG